MKQVSQSKSKTSTKVPTRKESVTRKVVSSKKTSPVLKKVKRYSKEKLRSLLLSPTFHVAFKVFFGLLISSGLFYGSYLVIGRSFANEVVISKSEIISRVGKLTPLPKEEPYDIVRVQDPDYLKKQNLFYKDIEEGDYILMYPNLAVIYNLRSNRVVGVKQGGEER